MVDEAHITTFAVHPAWRRQGIGERLLLAFLDLAVDRAAHEATLEVRLSQPAGPPAVREVRVPTGRAAPALLQRRPRGRADHDHRAAGGAEDARAHRPAARAPWTPRPAPTAAGRGRRTRMSGPLLLSIESSCDETGIALIEGGRRILSNVVASQVALHAPSGGIVPGGRRARPPALDRARSSTRPGRTPASTWDGRRRRSPSPTARAWPARCSSGINFAKALAWVHDKPLIGVNHLEGHVYAAWLLDPGEDEAVTPGAGLPARRPRRQWRAHVPRRDARPPDLSAARHDRRRRRRRGVRQGRPAARAWAIRAARPSSGRPRARPGATSASPGRGWATPTTGASPGSRPRPAGSSPMPVPRRASRRTTPRRTCPRRPWPSWPGASRTPSSTCS